MSEKERMIDWLERHDACSDGLEWAKAECNSLADVWAKAKPDWLVWVATRPGVMTNRDRVRLGAGCAERVRHLMTDQRSKDALDVCARYVRGEVTDQELAYAAAAARDATYATDAAAARDATYAAVAAARDATDATYAAAARDATYAADAAAAAARDAADAADAAAVYDAEREWQANFLRSEFKPNFGGGQ